MVMMIAVSVISNTGDTYLCPSNKSGFLDLQYKTLLINVKSIIKDNYIYVFGIVDYSSRV